MPAKRSTNPANGEPRAALSAPAADLGLRAPQPPGDAVLAATRRPAVDVGAGLGLGTRGVGSDRGMEKLAANVVEYRRWSRLPRLVEAERAPEIGEKEAGFMLAVVGKNSEMASKATHVYLVW
ncbi:unnamed protein product [Miscanthus lutarioriparius]|uniref:Uncharacterized protein n=1 Tax=Miscanthus lutarioriparius TaxID=422564 RepID=A0A811MK44_9POAL|nr:unnamed protein product [Miscanthus lutarioriparius]